MSAIDYIDSLPLLTKIIIKYVDRETGEARTVFNDQLSYYKKTKLFKYGIIKGSTFNNSFMKGNKLYLVIV